MAQEERIFVFQDTVTGTEKTVVLPAAVGDQLFSDENITEIIVHTTPEDNQQCSIMGKSLDESSTNVVNDGGNETRAPSFSYKTIKLEPVIAALEEMIARSSQETSVISSTPSLGPNDQAMKAEISSYSELVMECESGCQHEQTVEDRSRDFSVSVTNEQHTSSLQQNPIEEMHAAVSRLKLNFGKRKSESSTEEQESITERKVDGTAITKTGGKSGASDFGVESTQISKQSTHSADSKDSDSSLKCRYCSLTFRSPLSLDIHIFSHSHIDELTNNMMKKKAAVKRIEDKMKSLNTKIDRSKPFVCPGCNTEFPNRKQLGVHVKSEHDNSFIYCCLACRFVTFCHEEDAKHRSSQEHKNAEEIEKEIRASRPKKFLCSNCGNGYTTKIQLKNHISRKHLSPELRPFHCPHCSKIFPRDQKDKMEEHVAEHRKRVLKCPQCPYTTPFSDYLKKHTKTHFTAIIERFQCRECSAKFEAMAELRIHAFTCHNSTDKFFCPRCPFSTSNRDTYRSHRQTHIGKYRYHCDKCNFIANNPSGLREHEAIHTTEKKFPCSLCSMSFRTKKQCHSHTWKKHTKEKKYLCTHCPYACVTRSSLVTHMYVHSEMKCHQCPKCAYQCRTSGNLKKHMTVHDEVKAYPCELCKYKARLPEGLKRHMKLVHKMEVKVFSHSNINRFVEGELSMDITKTEAQQALEAMEVKDGTE